MSAKKCDSLANKIKNLEYPDICSFNGTYPIVCCLPSTGGPVNLTKKKNSNVVNESMCINILVYVDIMIIINTCSLLNYLLNSNNLNVFNNIIHVLNCIANTFNHY